MDPIQKYQEIKQRHRQAEINIAKAKTQVELYTKDIQDILTSESVSSVEELVNKYKAKQEELAALTQVLEKETALAESVLEKLGTIQ